MGKINHVFIISLVGLSLVACAPSEKNISDARISLNENGISRIVNGTPVSAADPISRSTVALYVSAATAENPNLIHNYCTGTLIAPQIVMTAAHCIAEYAVDEKTTPEQIALRTAIGFGIPVIKDRKQAGVEFRAVTGVIVHPGYIPYSSQHVNPDIALLKLAAPAPATAMAAKLVTDGEILQSGLQIVLAGFGKVDGVNKIPATQLMKTVVTVDKAYYSKTQFTYNPIGGHAACRGDSGGPAYLVSNEAQPLVIGVTSWGDATCQAQGAYTSVPAMLSWIRTNAGI
jgi:secreted trypsin-like serine protease